MNAQVYTKSGCIYCDKAKDLLEDMDIPYMEFPIETYKTVYLDDPEAKASSPQIFLDGQHIGGYDDLRTHLLGV